MYNYIFVKVTHVYNWTMEHTVKSVIVISIKIK